MMTDDSLGQMLGRVGDEGAAPLITGESDELEGVERQARLQKLNIQRVFAEQEHGLRQKYADWIIWLLGAQFVIADAVFVAFAWAGRSWELSPGVVEVWLAATVLRVVGVVAIVTRHLFPRREGDEARA